MALEHGSVPPRDGEAPVVVGFGEVLWDCFADRRRPGGAPANVAWHATQLGLRGFVVSCVGRDEDGRLLRRQLRERGLDLRYVREEPRLPTGSVGVDVTNIEAPRYTIREPAAWDGLVLDDDLLALARRASAVCFGTLVQRSRTSRKSLHEFLVVAHRACLLYDVNFRQDFYRREWVEASLRAANAVKLNEHEALQLAQLLGQAPSTPEALASHLVERYGVDITCVTRGARGCVLIEGDTVADVPGCPASVVDTVGAGDAFSAAFLAARLAGQSLEVTARFANAVGSLVATRPGAMPHLEGKYRDVRRNLFDGASVATAIRSSGRSSC